jgi:hypothetical protein
MQLLLSHNKYEVRTLLRMGMHPKIITQTFLRYFIQVFLLILTAGFVCFLTLKFFVDDIFQTGGIYLSESISVFAFLAILLTFIIFALASLRTAKREVLNLFNK